MLPEVTSAIMEIFPKCFGKSKLLPVLEFFVVSLVTHKSVLESVLPPNHLLRFSTLFRIPETELSLRKLLIQDDDDSTHLIATGVPPMTKMKVDVLITQNEVLNQQLCARGPRRNLGEHMGDDGTSSNSMTIPATTAPMQRDVQPRPVSPMHSVRAPPEVTSVVPPSTFVFKDHRWKDGKLHRLPDVHGLCGGAETPPKICIHFVTASATTFPRWCDGKRIIYGRV
ncbi:Aste57867_19850 [Aphanomyces stellatus]|uniref:Aste57867_19850 protein n=1 Tax=Aphanomyces stellatus TaxID=120398 RepID=A0A485LE93_9STRA|nr:hypothetical protein As57867_019785 [Aphanomyces stellatus]VFT96548.1 Aste57867_19850 [Aphanomyces stellatus]